MEEFNTAGDGVHPNLPDRYFAILVDAYLSETSNRGGFVGSASSYLLSARALLAFALPRLRAMALDGAVASNASPLGS
jgi:hypothetical protein